MIIIQIMKHLKGKYWLLKIILFIKNENFKIN
jgi:hypothetical protein